MRRDDLTALAMAARSGDEAAAAAFVRDSQVEVWRLLAHLAGRRVADDLVQETYLRVFRSLPRFRGDSSARTWLLSIARRVAVDHIRHASRRPREVGEVSATGSKSDGRHGNHPDVAPVAAGGDPSGLVPIRLLIRRLSPERREAFVLTQVLGLSYAEAAEVCGCPVGTIRSRVGRARGDLVAAMTETRYEAG